MHTIGVFDSGIGGLSVVKAIEKALPDSEVIWVSDHEHVPYGDKAKDEVRSFVVPILHHMVERGCEVIVIACNSVTTTLISELRQIVPVPLVGIEPMVKPAAEQTKTGVIAVCATPMTLRSERYAWLKHTYAPTLHILEPDCRRWAYMIEHGAVEEVYIAEQINHVCDQGADIIVLGCTHYHWIERTIQRLAAGRARVLQPESAVITQLKQVLLSL